MSKNIITISIAMFRNTERYTVYIICLPYSTYSLICVNAAYDNNRPSSLEWVLMSHDWDFVVQ